MPRTSLPLPQHLLERCTEGELSVDSLESRMQRSAMPQRQRTPVALAQDAALLRETVMESELRVRTQFPQSRGNFCQYLRPQFLPHTSDRLGAMTTASTPASTPSFGPGGQPQSWPIPTSCLQRVTGLPRVKDNEVFPSHPGHGGSLDLPTSSACSISEDLVPRRALT